MLGLLGKSPLFTFLCYKIRELVLSTGCWHLGAEEPGEKALLRGHGGHSTLHPALALLLITGERAPVAHPQPLSHRCGGGSRDEPQGCGHGWQEPLSAADRAGLLQGLAEPARMGWALWHGHSSPSPARVCRAAVGPLLP